MPRGWATRICGSRRPGQPPALSKLGDVAVGRYRGVSQPPVVLPARELAGLYGVSVEAFEGTVFDQFQAAQPTLPNHRRRCWNASRSSTWRASGWGSASSARTAPIALLEGRHAQEPLFLPRRGRRAVSVLEVHRPKSRYRNPGPERVVQGQRLMTSKRHLPRLDKGLEAGRFYHWRQLGDMKGSALVDNMSEPVLGLYTRMCGWTLARADARSGDSVAIAEYLGSDDAFDRAIADFSQRYADQNELDHQALAAAVRSGRAPAVDGV